jgi:hypothetical protein
LEALAPLLAPLTSLSAVSVLICSRSTDVTDFLTASESLHTEAPTPRHGHKPTGSPALLTPLFSVSLLLFHVGRCGSDEPRLCLTQVADAAPLPSSMNYPVGVEYVTQVLGSLAQCGPGAGVVHLNGKHDHSTEAGGQLELVCVCVCVCVCVRLRACVRAHVFDVPHPCRS